MNEFVFSKKESDGWVAKHVNARISIPISRILASYGIHPNWITLMNLPFVLLAAYLVTKPSYAAGALAGIAFQWCSIFDGCDGEVARACNKVSVTGGWLDTIMDNLCYVLFISGLGIWYGGGLTSKAYPMLAVAALLAASLALTYVGMWKMGTSCHKKYREAFRRSSDRSPGLDELGRRENFSFIVMFLLLFGLRTYLYYGVLIFAALYSIGIIVTYPKIISYIRQKERS